MILNIVKTVSRLAVLTLVIIAMLPISFSKNSFFGTSGISVGDSAYAQRKKRQNLFELLFKRKKNKRKSAKKRRGGNSPKIVSTKKKRKKRNKAATRKRAKAVARKPVRSTKPKKTSNRDRTIAGVGAGSAASTLGAPVVKSETAFKVLVVGDFMADGLSYGLEKAFVEDPNVVFVNAAQGLSGIVRNDVYDWPSKTKELIEEIKPVAVIGLIGMNDRQEMKLTNGRAQKRSEPWNKEYLARVKQLVSAMRTNNTPFLWVGLPPVRQSSMTSDYTVFNEIYRTETETAGGEFIDVWDGFTNQDGKFISAGPNINGQIVRLRSSDGINMTRAAKRKMAFFVEKPLKRLIGLGPGNALSRLGSFGGSQEPLKPEYNPAVTGKTIVVSLSGPDLDGGDVLEGGEAVDGPKDGEKSVSYELVSRGSPTKRRIGRVDAGWGPAAPKPVESKVVKPVQTKPSIVDPAAKLQQSTIQKPAEDTTALRKPVAVPSQTAPISN